MTDFLFARSVLLPFPPSDEPTTEGSAKLNVMEAGLTARSEAQGRGRKPKPFVTVQGCTVTKAPAGMESRRVPRVVRAARNTGNVLCLLSCAKKVGRPPGQDPAAALNYEAWSIVKEIQHPAETLARVQTFEIWRLP